MSKPSWPYKTDTELNAAGYKFDRHGVCNGANCRAHIEWWITPIKHNAKGELVGGKPMPLDPATMQPHWATCPDRQQFKRGK